MQTKENEDEALKKKKINSLVIPALFALLATGLFYMRFSSIIVLSWWGYAALLAAIFFTLFTITFLLETGVIKIKKGESKDKTKANRVEFIFLIIDAITTGGFVYINWSNLASLPTLWAIAEVAIFFATVWAIFELYNRFTWIPFRLLNFVYEFVFYICIPMMFVWIIFLGGLQAKYNYTDVLSPAINTTSIEFGETMQKVYVNLISKLYEMGQSNPDLWSWLPIAALVISTLLLIYKNFTKREKEDNEKTAAELLKEIVLDDLDEEREKTEKRKPLFNLHDYVYKLITSKKSKEKEAKEEEAEEQANKNLPKYQITFKQLKGGK
jgi:hypothetical protein